MCWRSRCGIGRGGEGGNELGAMRAERGGVRAGRGGGATEPGVASARGRGPAAWPGGAAAHPRPHPRALAIALLAGAACGGAGGGDGGDGGSGDGGGMPGDGIAAMYPGDVGIAGDPRVLFADDFESYASAAELTRTWDAVYHQVRIATEPANVHAGGRAVEFTAPQQTAELSNTIARVLTGDLDVLYLRYYSRYEDTFDVTGSSHNGAEISAGYYVNGNASPGVPADGSNKYLIAYEHWRGEAATPSPGELNIYIYHPGQRSNYGDHFFPDGRVLPNSSIPGDFGPEFEPRPDVIPELGRWYAYEVMLRANTPGQRDGRITCWIDGEVVADFPGLRLRDVDTLTIDHVSLSLHTGSNPSRATRKWYDDVVAATAYIGPMVPP